MILQLVVGICRALLMHVLWGFRLFLISWILSCNAVRGSYIRQVWPSSPFLRGGLCFVALT